MGAQRQAAGEPARRGGGSSSIHKRNGTKITVCMIQYMYFMVNDDSLCCACALQVVFCQRGGVSTAVLPVPRQRPRHAQRGAASAHSWRGCVAPKSSAHTIIYILMMMPRVICAAACVWEAGSSCCDDLYVVEMARAATPFLYLWGQSESGAGNSGG